MDFKKLNKILCEALSINELNQKTVDSTERQRRDNVMHTRDAFIDGTGTLDDYIKSIKKLDNFKDLADKRQTRQQSKCYWTVYVVPTSDIKTNTVEDVLKNVNYFQDVVNDINLIRLTLAAAEYYDNITSVEEAIEWWEDCNKFIVVGSGDKLRKMGVGVYTDDLKTPETMSIWVDIDNEI